MPRISTSVGIKRHIDLTESITNFSTQDLFSKSRNVKRATSMPLSRSASHPRSKQTFNSKSFGQSSSKSNNRLDPSQNVSHAQSFQYQPHLSHNEKPLEVSSIWDSITIDPKSRQKSTTDSKSLLRDVPSFNFNDGRSRFNVITPIERKQRNHPRKVNRKLTNPACCLCCLLTTLLSLVLLGGLIAAIVLATTAKTTTTSTPRSTTTRTTESSTTQPTTSSSTSTSTSTSSTSTSVSVTTSATTTLINTTTETTTTVTSTTGPITTTTTASSVMLNLNNDCSSNNVNYDCKSFSFTCSTTLTNLTIQINISKVVGATYANMENTLWGSIVSESHIDTGVVIMYTWKINSGQTVNCPQSYIVRARITLPGVFQPNNTATYSISTTATNGVSTFASGIF